MFYILTFNLFDESILQFNPSHTPMAIIIKYLMNKLFPFFSEFRSDSPCLLQIGLGPNRHDGVASHQFLVFMPQSPFHRGQFRNYGQFGFDSFYLWH